MQISNTNTVFLSHPPFRRKDREHKRLSVNIPVWEPPSTTLLPCQPAARPIPPQYASPPVDLVRMLFIVPQTNRIADEHLDYTASLSSQQRVLAPGSRAEPNTSPTVVCFIPLPFAVNLRTGDYILVYLHRIVPWHKCRMSVTLCVR